jgi:P pilus assembly chaperone PapD
VQPNSKQIVRVLLTGAADDAREITLRVVLTEIGAPSTQSGSVTARLAVSLPVFVLPNNPVAPKMEWAVARQGPYLKVTGHNAGTAHTRLLSLRLAGEDGATLVDEAHTDYVLAGDSCSWLLPAAHLPAGAHFTAVNEEREISLAVPVS